MTFTERPDFLRNVLLVDAATCVASGLLMTIGATAVSRLTHLPAGLLVAAGLSLLPIAAFMIYVATRPQIWINGVWLIIVGNIGWVLASLLLLIGGITAPNALGMAFVIAQAAAVAILAQLELVGVRKLGSSNASSAG